MKEVSSTNAAMEASNANAAMEPTSTNAAMGSTSINAPMESTSTNATMESTIATSSPAATYGQTSSREDANQETTPILNVNACIEPMVTLDTATPCLDTIGQVTAGMMARYDMPVIFLSDGHFLLCDDVDTVRSGSASGCQRFLLAGDETLDPCSVFTNGPDAAAELSNSVFSYYFLFKG